MYTQTGGSKTEPETIEMAKKRIGIGMSARAIAALATLSVIGAAVAEPGARDLIDPTIDDLHPFPATAPFVDPLTMQPFDGLDDGASPRQWPSNRPWPYPRDPAADACWSFDHQYNFGIGQGGWWGYYWHAGGHANELAYPRPVNPYVPIYGTPSCPTNGGFISQCWNRWHGTALVPGGSTYAPPERFVAVQPRGIGGSGDDGLPLPPELQEITIDESNILVGPGSGDPNGAGPTYGSGDPEKSYPFPYDYHNAGFGYSFPMQSFWFERNHGGPVVPWLSRGFPQNVDLRAPLARVGDFPPFSHEPLVAGSPLVPASKGKSYTLVPFQEREHLFESYDPLTGATQLQHVDFELPLGSGTFQFVRSYASNHVYPGMSQAENDGAMSPGTWDWAGHGWMINTNPLFLIDAALPEMVDPADAGEIGTRRCVFVPDASRSIPFLFDPDNGTYSAPDYIDASLRHDGNWQVDPAHFEGGYWIGRPTRYWVELYAGAVTYEIEPIWEDVPWVMFDNINPRGEVPDGADERDYHHAFSGVFSIHPDYWRSDGEYEFNANFEIRSAHELPNEMDPYNILSRNGFASEHTSVSANYPGGQGVPFRGRVLRIYDRDGNEIENHYAPHEQIQAGAWGLKADEVEEHYELHSMRSEPYGVNCSECVQTCVGKGRLTKSVLRSNGSVEWEIWYTYRSFFGGLMYGDKFMNMPGQGFDFRCDDLETQAEEDACKRKALWWSMFFAPVHLAEVLVYRPEHAPSAPLVQDTLGAEHFIAQDPAQFWSASFVPGNEEPNVPGHEDLASIDAVDAVSRLAPLNPGSGLTDNWHVRTKYTYSEMFIPGAGVRWRFHPYESGQYAETFVSALPDNRNLTRGDVPRIWDFLEDLVYTPQAFRDLGGFPTTTILRSPIGNIDEHLSEPHVFGGRLLGGTPSLLKATTERRPEIGQDASLEEAFVYHYTTRMYGRWLAAVFDIDSLRSVAERLGAGDTAQGVANKILRLGDYDIYRVLPEEASPGEITYPRSVIGTAAAEAAKHLTIFGAASSTIGAKDWSHGVFREAFVDHIADLNEFLDLDIGRILIHENTARVQASRSGHGGRRIFASVNGLLRPADFGSAQHLDPQRIHNGNRDASADATPAYPGSIGLHASHDDPFATAGPSTGNEFDVSAIPVRFPEHGADLAMPGHSISYYPFNYLSTHYENQWLHLDPNDRSSPLFVSHPPVPWTPTDSESLVPPGLDPVRFTLIDEYDSSSIESYDNLVWYEYFDPNDPSADRGELPPLLSRRVIKYNKYGFKISDRTWRFDPDDEAAAPELADAEGYTETFEFDEHLRLTERRTIGWGAAELASINAADGSEDEGLETRAGLIEVFQYPERPQGASLQDVQGRIQHASRAWMYPTHRGFKSGTESDVYWAERWVRHTYRPEIVLEHTRYQAEDKDNLVGSPNVYTTLVETNLGPNDSDAWRDPLQFRITRAADPIESGRVYPGSGSSVPLYPVSAEYYDAAGLLRWRGRGHVENYQNPGTGASDVFHVDGFGYDGRGRLTAQVIDIDPTTIGTGDPDGPRQQLAALPAGWDPSLPASVSTHLDLATSHEYDDMGLVRSDLPDGTSVIVEREVELINGELSITETRVEDVPTGEYDGFAGFTFAGLPAGLTEISGGQLVSRSSGVMTGGDVSGADLELFLEIDSVVKPVYDSSGRVSGVSIETPEGDLIEQSMEFDRSGRPGKTVDDSGTITRRAYDGFERLTHVYRGTRDIHSVWRNTNGGSNEDNLILTEKRYYGDSYKDAHQLTVMRRYRDKPSNQYVPVWLDDSQLEPGQSRSNEDEIGDIFRFGYDWRMRQVSTQVETEGSPASTVERTVYTWLDHLDRPQLRAVYGGATAPVGGGTIDPRARAPGAANPTAATVLGAGGQLMQLHELIYNSQNQIIEHREHDTGSTSGSDYVASYFVYDGEGRRILVDRPGQLAQRMTYDGMGRLVSTDLIDGAGTEFESSDSIYRADYQHADRVVTLMRPAEMLSSDKVLTTANAVGSAVLQWFDDRGRVIAQAALGSNRTDGFSGNFEINPATIAFDAEAPPTWNATTGSYDLPVSSGVSSPTGWVDPRITLWEYDEDNQVVAERRPDGVLSTWEYDGLGRKLLEITNAEGGTSADSIITAYDYDGDRLVAIADVPPSMRTFPLGQPRDLYDSLDLSKPSLVPGINESDEAARLNITFIDYGAAVVNSAGCIVSEDASAIRAITLNGTRWTAGTFGTPQNQGDPAQNGLDLEGSFVYMYTPQGEIATRTDKRHWTLASEYDALGRVTRVTSGDHPCSSLSLVAPAGRGQVVRTDTEYDALGRVLDARAYGQISGRNGVVSYQLLNHATFEYDSFGNVLRSMAQNGTMVDDTTAGVAAPLETGYDWLYDWASGNGNNAIRLASMDYPSFLDPAATNGTQGRREIGFTYTDAGKISRITEPVPAIPGGDPAPPIILADYAYDGAMRRVASYFGNGTRRELRELDVNNTPTGLLRTGLSLHGEIIDHHTLRESDSALIFRSRHAYDAAGRRLHDDIDRVLMGDDASWVYAHDDGDRLVGADLGRFDGAGGSIEEGDGVSIPDARRLSWRLDQLGAWSGGGTQIDGRQEMIDGVSDVVTSTTHDADWSGRVETVTDVDASGTSSLHTLYYDAAGNLIADGDYVYSYDGWNRLYGVARIGSLQFSGGGTEPAEITGGVSGAGVYQIAYDGLGRIASRTLVDESGTPFNADAWIERYAYDGTRRIHVDRRSFNAAIGNTGDPTSLDGYETYQQYVYGGDAFEEHLVHYDEDGDRYWAIVNVNMDVLGLVDEAGQVTSEYTYSPYGRVLDARFASGSTVPDLQAGLHGMFAVSLSGDTQQAPLDPTSSATPLYQTLNRHYHSELGRWVRRDPIGTGPVASLSSLGSPIQLVGLMPPSMEQQFTDGTSLYLFVKGYPSSGRDPLGLFDFSLSGMMGGTGVRAGLQTLGNSVRTLGPRGSMRMAEATVDGVFSGLSAAHGGWYRGEWGGQLIGNFAQGAITGFAGGLVGGEISQRFAKHGLRSQLAGFIAGQFYGRTASALMSGDDQTRITGGDINGIISGSGGLTMDFLTKSSPGSGIVGSVTAGTLSMVGSMFDETSVFDW